jgi:hypothetical protein
MDPKSKVVPLTLTIPLGTLANGDYLCQIAVLVQPARGLPSGKPE